MFALPLDRSLRSTEDVVASLVYHEDIKERRVLFKV